MLWKLSLEFKFIQFFIDEQDTQSEEEELVSNELIVHKFLKMIVGKIEVADSSS